MPIRDADLRGLPVTVLPSNLQEKQSELPLMGTDVAARYQTAKKIFQECHYEQAISHLSHLAFDLLVSKEDNILMLDCMQMTIDAFKKITPQAIVDAVLEDAGNDPEDQYFHVVRYHFDHREEHDEKKIRHEIFHHIPLGASEMRYFTYGQGTALHHHHALGKHRIGVAEAQGPRGRMEDCHLFAEITLNIEKQTKIPLFVIFDGHAGPSCAKYAQSRLSSMLQEELQKIADRSDKEIYNALVRSCVHLHDEWCALPFQKSIVRDFSGTTATLALLIDDALWVANVGDSRAVLAAGEEAVQLSEEAKPTIRKYIYDILFRGGFILFGRVDGNLDMARSIGDIDHPSLTARPTVRKILLSEFPKEWDKTLILACDGLWDVVGPKTAVAMVRHKPPMAAAVDLRNLAFRNGTWDNVTVMVIKLHL